MAYKELKCKNCSSLIRFKQEEDQICIFCYAPNRYEEALEASESQDFVFPHQSYEKPDEEKFNQSLALYHPNKHHTTQGRKTTSSQPTQAQEKKQQQALTEPVLSTSVELLDVHANKKVLWGSILSFVLIVSLIVGMTIPLTLQRNAAREKILASLSAQGIKNLEQSERVDFRSHDNKKLTLILHSEANEEMAKEYFSKFQKALQSTYGDAGIQDLSQIHLALLHAKKSYYIHFDKDTQSLKISSSGK